MSQYDANVTDEPVESVSTEAAKAEEKARKSTRKGLLISAIAIVVVLIVCVAITARPKSNSRASSRPSDTTMYFCGYDRCQDSGEYGNLIFATGINVWNNPEPDRGGVHHTARHGDRVVVIDRERVYDGPGGLWFELQGGGWTNDLWLTRNECNSGNLETMDFTDCLAGEY